MTDVTDPATLAARFRSGADLLERKAQLTSQLVDLSDQLKEVDALLAEWNGEVFPADAKSPRK